MTRTESGRHGAFAIRSLTSPVDQLARRWRWPVVALLAYLPVSGIPILLSYPDTDAAVLAKDFLFVIPAYLAFLAHAYSHRERVAFRGAPTLVLVMLGALVLLQALNPALPNTLVGAIGVKVWLFYLPLLYLGYHFVRDREDLCRLLTLVALGAILPAAVGVAEATLFRLGAEDFVYRLYGDAAGPATQNFTALELPDGSIIRRVPSTFSSWTQYFAFLATMTAVTYAWWRAAPAGKGRAVARALVWLLVLAAALVSGARIAFAFIPALVVLTVALERLGARGRPRQKLSPAWLAAPAAAVVFAAALLGAGVRDVVRETAWKAKNEFTDTFVDRFRQATEITWSGLGTGIDTIASRYAFSSPDQFEGVGGSWYESWYVKVVLELGLPGLALVTALFALILVRGLRAHARLRDAGLRAVSAAFIAFLVLNIVALTGKPYLDYDPINVYFWFLAGVLAKLPHLDAPAASPEVRP